MCIMRKTRVEGGGWGETEREKKNRKNADKLLHFHRGERPLFFVLSPPACMSVSGRISSCLIFKEQDIKYIFISFHFSTHTHTQSLNPEWNIQLPSVCVFVCMCVRSQCHAPISSPISTGVAPETGVVSPGVPPRCSTSQHGIRRSSPFPCLTKKSLWHFIPKPVIIFCHVAVKMSFAAGFEYRVTFQPPITWEAEWMAKWILKHLPRQECFSQGEGHKPKVRFIHHEWYYQLRL